MKLSLTVNAFVCTKNAYVDNAKLDYSTKAVWGEYIVSRER